MDLSSPKKSAAADRVERRAAAPDSADVLDAEIARLESQLAVVEAELRRADPRYAELRYPQPIGLDVLRDRVLAAGRHVVTWDGTDRRGRAAAAGTYFLVLRTPAGDRVAKAALVK